MIVEKRLADPRVHLKALQTTSKTALTTLGGFALQVNGLAAQSPATRKARALMAFLVMNTGTDTARERLLEIFWPDAEPERARASLNTALHSIRRCLRTAGADADLFLLATKSIVRWTSPTSLDAAQFVELAGREEPAAAEAALQLYRGDFLEGDYDDWSIRERERLAALYETVLARVVKTSKNADAAQRFIARNPYDESAYVALVEAELAVGRRSSAASWVERCRNALAEVGDKPSASFEKRFGGITNVTPLVSQELTLPFAGRETELAFIAAKFEDAATGRGSITIVQGEAGIGKSALLARAASIAATRGLQVVSVRCADEADTAFGPWPRIFGIAREPDLDSFVAAHAGDLVHAAANAVNARLPDNALLLVDDAHGLQREALDILIAVAEAAAPKHAVIIATRPEGVAGLAARLAHVQCDEIVLAGLDRSTLQWALAQALGGQYADVFDVLYDRTAGHPLFFTGLLNSLVDTGALARSGHHWHFVHREGRIELPDTVRRFIEARLHARGDAPRALACALALEPSATSEDLAAVLRFDEPTTLDGLDDLLALGLIVQPSSGPQFAFTHDLVREVAAMGLNAGRRAALHRAFAQRLRASGRLQSPLRLARHFEAAGELLPAADAYLRSATEALALNAPQDAHDRCESGIRALETVEPSPGRTIALSSLYRVAARAELANGRADAAVARARDAVSLVAGARDIGESGLALLDLAIAEGQACAFDEQRADAFEAAAASRRCGNAALEAEALLQLACALRELGLRDEAYQACDDAQRLALACGEPIVLPLVLQERLYEQITWWSFASALETAAAGLDTARRVAPYVEAEFLLARSALRYLLGQFNDADAELVACRRFLTSVGKHPASGVRLRSLPQIEFASHCMAARTELARGRYQMAFAAIASAEGLSNVAKLPGHSAALALLRIDALLQRNDAEDCVAAQAAVLSLDHASKIPAMLRWSDCAELARARIAVRVGMPDGSAQLRQVLDLLEDGAQEALLDVDVSFARLADAAEEAGDAMVARRAGERAKWYRSRRIAAAGAAWGAR